ncbi:phospholipase D-like domain-containing protein [Paeniglutamicibacter sp. ZC-3]|uniref:phospholipase D-like domain-containing protein n=1 Tax=Paeniglutamicibacter sp. ZC-3 TaxID=2986919 RepID=UPI0021F7D782|nr:phospholipase D-like domain-containing protein [Paeniglutamicibacter sp. ZC-3]MCV9996046.1 phospholipase D-like domain-containing protein [Paeniglutamicibacter sp. ZC-3]
MLPEIPDPVVVAAKKSFTRLVLAFLALQAAVVGALVLYDAFKHRQRTKRPNFPQPGVFEGRVADSEVTIYTYGEDLYADMLAAIRGAKTRVFLETFIWKSDDTGRRFKEALAEAAERGVEVFVVYDGFANLVVPQSFYRFHPKIHVYRFPVLRPSRLFTPLRSTGLDHRKLLVVDDETGFVGGYNIGDLYATEWRDTHVRITGPSVWDLRQAFVGVWNTVCAEPEIPHHPPQSWDPHIRTVNNIPAHLVYPIRGIYLEAINRAQSHVYITTAYFIPDKQILRALIAASKRGVDVRLIQPEDSNHVLADWLSRGFYTSLLREGVTVLLYRNAMIHAKTATIDGHWSTIGTANIDRLSLTGNYETNLEIHDRAFAADMEKIFEIDSTNCRELTLTEWKERNFAAPISETILIPLRPFL